VTFRTGLVRSIRTSKVVGGGWPEGVGRDEPAWGGTGGTTGGLNESQGPTGAKAMGWRRCPAV